MLTFSTRFHAVLNTKEELMEQHATQVFSKEKIHYERINIIPTERDLAC